MLPTESQTLTKSSPLWHGNIWAPWVSRHCFWKCSTQVTMNSPLFQRAEGSRPLCVCVLICHFTPLSFKCHTVASTSLLMGLNGHQWWLDIRLVRLLLRSICFNFPLWMQVSLHLYVIDTLLYWSSVEKKTKKLRVGWFVLHVQSSTSNFPFSLAFKIISCIYFLTPGDADCCCAICWTWRLCLRRLEQKLHLCQHPTEIFSHIFLWRSDQ